MEKEEEEGKTRGPFVAAFPFSVFAFIGCNIVHLPISTYFQNLFYVVPNGIIVLHLQPRVRQEWKIC